MVVVDRVVVHLDNVVGPPAGPSAGVDSVVDLPAVVVAAVLDWTLHGLLQAELSTSEWAHDFVVNVFGPRLENRHHESAARLMLKILWHNFKDALLYFKQCLHKINKSGYSKRDLA